MRKKGEERNDPPPGEGIPPRILKVIREVAKKHGSTLEKILGPSCCAEEVFPRHEAIRAVAEFVGWSPWSFKGKGGTGWSLPRIAKIFNRDHTTVLYVLRGGYKKRIDLLKSPDRKIPYAGKESEEDSPLPLFPLLHPSRGK